MAIDLVIRITQPEDDLGTEQLVEDIFGTIAVDLDPGGLIVEPNQRHRGHITVTPNHLRERILPQLVFGADRQRDTPDGRQIEDTESEETEQANGERTDLLHSVTLFTDLFFLFPASDNLLGIQTTGLDSIAHPRLCRDETQASTTIVDDRDIGFHHLLRHRPRGRDVLDFHGSLLGVPGVDRKGHHDDKENSSQLDNIVRVHDLPPVLGLITSHPSIFADVTDAMRSLCTDEPENKDQEERLRRDFLTEMLDGPVDNLC